MFLEARTEPSRAKSGVALTLILLVAAWLRIWGLDYGLPHPLTRPDEERIVGRAHTIFATGDWHPGSFFYPSLLFYMDTLALAAYYGVHKADGTYREPFDFLFEIAVTRPGLHYWICRWVGALAGIFTVAAAYFLGASAYGSRAVGLLAAGLLAVCHLHVRDSHFATVDVVMTLFITLSLVFAVRAAKRPSSTHFVLAGVFAGFATSTKYNAGLVTLAIAVAGWCALRSSRLEWTTSLKRTALAGLATVLAFAATSPYVLLRYSGFLADMTSLRSFLYRPVGDLALWEHLRTTLPTGLGGLLFATAVLAVARALWLRRASDWVLLGFLLPYFLLISSVRVTFPRYVLPMTPILVVMAAGLLYTSRRWNVIDDPRIRRLAQAITIVFLIWPNLERSVRFDQVLARADTRVEAASWIGENVPPRTEILACDGYGAPHINEDRRRPPAFIVESVDCTSPPVLDEAEGSFLVTHEHSELSGFSRIHPSLATWLEENTELVAEFDPYRRDSAAKPFFYVSDAFYVPFDGFEAVERGCPLIRIWKLESPQTQPR